MAPVAAVVTSDRRTIHLGTEPGPATHLWIPNSGIDAGATGRSASTNRRPTFLERWWPTLAVAPGARVYVPLCGKSIDMVWLAVRGYAVVGSELSSVAVADFFGEQQSQQLQRTDVVLESRGPFNVHRAGSYELLQGDALQLTPELLGPVHAAYDRAALVALPPAMRGTMPIVSRR